MSRPNMRSGIAFQGPLSLEKMTMVLSATPAAASAARTWPTESSSSVITSP
jgi:hypothetical protein